MASRRGYPVIGGPLNGQLAREADMYPERRAVRAVGRWKQGDVVSPGGKFGAYAKEYAAFNRADAHVRVPTRIWLHVSLLAA